MEESSTITEEAYLPLDQHQQAAETKTVKAERITSNRMTKFEKAHILGVRALQLSMNAPPLVDIEDETDPLKIALKELKEGKVPFIIRRRLPDNSFEEWSIKEMIIPYD